jgi:hypothetical protein
MRAGRTRTERRIAGRNYNEESFIELSSSIALKITCVENK